VKHDWTTIRNEYVEGIEQNGKILWPTMRGVAAGHGMDGTVLRLRAAKEKWADLRNQYKAKQLHARQTARVKIVANAGAKFDSKILGIAQMLAARLTVMMGEMDQTHDPEPYRKVASALVNVQRAGRIALGEPADGPLPSGTSQVGTMVIRIIRDGPYGSTLESVARTEHSCSQDEMTADQKPTTNRAELVAVDLGS